MEEAYEYLKALPLSSADTLVVAVSGGPDSMALLSLCLRIKQELGLNVVCAHVNHKVRKESDEEQLFVEAYCKKHGAIFELLVIQEYGTINFHQEARQKRYQFFEQMIQKYQANYLLTAHHGDDLMETILMRLVRGSTLKGYAGFTRRTKKATYDLIRPFLSLTKEELLTYDRLHKIPFVVDASNEKDTYTRNRFRKYVLPALKEESPLVHLKFQQFSTTLFEYYDYVVEERNRLLPEVMCSNQLIISKWKHLHPLFQKQILFWMLEHAYPTSLDQMEQRHVDLISKLICGTNPNGRLSLPGGKQAIRTYDFLSIEESSLFQPYEMELKEDLLLPNGKTICFTKEEDDSNFTCRLLSSELSFPLSVRTRKEGDQMVIRGMTGHKKVKDFMIDRKLSLEERKTTPIVVDQQDQIVWIPGLTKTKFSKTKEEKYDIILRYC